MAKINGDDIQTKLQNKGTKQSSFNAAIQAELKQAFPAIKTIVPRHMTPERLARMALTTISRTPKLAQCTPASLVGAVMNCAVLGLEPNLMGHAYLVPYWNNRQRVYECQFQIGYKGYMELIRRTGEVSQIYARKVYANDLFIYLYGEQNTLVHVPFDMLDYLDNAAPPADDNGLLQRLTAGAARLIRQQAPRGPGEVVKYYAAYKLKDGSFGFQVVTGEQALDHAKKFSSSKSNGKLVGPWVEHFDAMAMKTAVKELVKYMPISIEIQEKLTLDDAVLTPARDGDETNIFDVEFTVEGERQPAEGGKGAPLSVPPAAAEGQPETPGPREDAPAADPERAPAPQPGSNIPVQETLSGTAAAGGFDEADTPFD